MFILDTVILYPHLIYMPYKHKTLRNRSHKRHKKTLKKRGGGYKKKEMVPLVIDFDLFNTTYNTSIPSVAETIKTPKSKTSVKVSENKWEVSFVGDNFTSYTHPKYTEMSTHSHCTHWKNGDKHCKHQRGSDKCGIFENKFVCTHPIAREMYQDFKYLEI